MGEIKSLKQFVKEDSATSVSRSELESHLTTLVDRFGLAKVLDDLSEICGYKGEAIENDLEDSVLGDKWKKAGDRIDAVASSVRNLKNP